MHSLFAVLIDIGRCFMVVWSMTGAKHCVARSDPRSGRLLYDTSNSTLLLLATQQRFECASRIAGSELSVPCSCLQPYQ